MSRRPIAVLFLIPTLAGIGSLVAARPPRQNVSPPILDVRAFPRQVGNAAAGATKATVCAACHGADGNAIAPSFPSLAGQPADYLYLQLISFRDGRRTSAVMQPVVTNLGDPDLRDLAAHFASLDRHPTGSTAATQAVARGAQLYLEGHSDGGAPPCQGCHGPHAGGLPATGGLAGLVSNGSTYPALAGLPADYIVAQLEAFRTGTRAGTTNTRIMQGVALTLDAQKESDLGAYLATLSLRR